MLVIQKFKQKIFDYVDQIDLFLFISLLIFSGLMLPGLGALPYLDGNVDFVKSNDYRTGGINLLLQNWKSVHPPVKEFLYTLTQGEFINLAAFYVLRIPIGLIGLLSLYFIAKKLFDRTTAKVSVFLLACSPLFLSTGFFLMTDYIVTNLILLAIALYTNSKYAAYAFITTLAVLTKETAILLPIVIIFVSFLENLITAKKENRFCKFKTYKNLLLFFIPLFVFGAWLLYLKQQGKSAWGDWIFASTASKGTFYTIAYNLISFNFINKYGIQNWRQFFLLNFNWIYSAIILLGTLIWLWSLKDAQKPKIIRQIKQLSPKAKNFIVIFLFCFSYLLMVLTFQTYSIPRYALPLIPFLLLCTAWASVYLARKSIFILTFLLVLVGAIVPLSLFSSVDPVSSKLFGEANVLGHKLYNLKSNLSGNDGITYNYQFILIAKERSDAILQANENFTNIISSDCRWMFPDTRNDAKTLAALGIWNHSLSDWCKKQ